MTSWPSVSGFLWQVLTVSVAVKSTQGARELGKRTWNKTRDSALVGRSRDSAGRQERRSSVAASRGEADIACDSKHLIANAEHMTWFVSATGSALCLPPLGLVQRDELEREGVVVETLVRILGRLGSIASLAIAKLCVWDCARRAGGILW